MKPQDINRKLAEIDEALLTAKRGTQKRSLEIRRAEIEKERERLIARGERA